MYRRSVLSWPLFVLSLCVSRPRIESAAWCAPFVPIRLGSSSQLVSAGSPVAHVENASKAGHQDQRGVRTERVGPLEREGRPTRRRRVLATRAIAAGLDSTFNA